MTSLQCAATLLLAPPGEAERLAELLARRRVAHVWSGADDAAAATATVVADRLGVTVTTRPELDGPDLAEVLHEAADAHPGETALVVAGAAAILASLPSLARMTTAPGLPRPGRLVEVVADADAWVCTRWPVD